MKFYAHNVGHARALRDKRHLQANTLYDEYSDPWFAEVQLLRLEEVVATGLPDCYASMNDFWHDFFPGFSWEIERELMQIELMVIANRYQAVREHFKTEWNVDLDEVLDGKLPTGMTNRGESAT